jgi:hypothetical protein
MDPAPFLLTFALYWMVLCACSALVSQEKPRGTVAVALPLLYILALGLLFDVLVPCQRLWLGTVGLLFTLKASILLLRSRENLHSFSKLGLLIYMSVWPGMNPQPFRATEACSEDGTRFVRGYICFWLGLLFLVASSTLVPSQAAAGWSCLVALLLMIHFGYAEMLSCALRLAGWNVQPLFDAPLRSNTLRDFWSKRWNIAFVEMDKILFLPLAQRLFKGQVLILSVFIMSGVLHEIGISYASGQLWGLPLLYFIIQGVGIITEKPLFKALTLSPLVSKVFTMAWIIAPLPLLFNGAFRGAFFEPLMAYLKLSLGNLSPRSLLSIALWLAAAGHFSTLMAGLQVPFRLHWKEELGRLTTFNAKILFYCAACVGLFIVTFGCLTIALHGQLLQGNKAAITLAIIISLFWIARLLVDCFYFHHSDWPKGPEFVIGHTLLNSLFIFLATVYSCLVWQHWPMVWDQQINISTSIGTEKLLGITISDTLRPWAGAPTYDWLFSQAIWLAAFGNLVVLVAGAQAPFRLKWKEDLAKLSNFNRKIMINYWAYVFAMVMSFGCLTFTLHDQFLLGDGTAVLLALAIALFWTFRVAADCFYFSHADWPKGIGFAVGHALLRTLFVCLAIVYSSIVLVHWSSLITFKR